jgi:hypothetical protein
MNLVENHELDVSNEIGALVKHAPENLGCHDQTIRLGVDLDISSKNPNRGRPEGLLEIPEFLV